MFPPARFQRLFRVVFAVVLVGYLILGWILPPALFNDLAAGWQVYQGMRLGAPFNCFLIPDSQDLARTVPAFQAWWSPGQYLVPSVLVNLGLSLGHAVVVLGIAGNLLGVVGYRNLWREWGVNEQLSLVSALVVIFSRAFGAVIGTANLADVFMFAAIPWSALLAWRLRRSGAWSVALLVVVTSLGMGLKLSFLVSAAAILAGLITDASMGGIPPRIRCTLVTAGKSVLILVVAKLSWDFTYLRHGASISAAHGFSLPGAADLSMPWGAPLLSAFGGGNLLGRIFLSPGHALLASEEGLYWFYIASGVLTVGLLIWLWRYFPARGYVVQSASWLSVYGVIFTWFYSTGAPVSFDERHFRAVGLLLLPGALAWMGALKHRPSRYAAYAIVVGFSAYGMGSVVINARLRARFSADSRLGFMHTELTKGALAELHRLDRGANHDTVFYVTKPEIAIEVEHARVICIPLDSWTSSFVEQWVFHGRTGRLILVIPDRGDTAHKLALAEREFTDYRAWSEVRVDGFVFASGN